MDQESLEMLEALLEVDDGMTDWEVDFVESLSHQKDRDLSKKQKDCLERIYNEHLR